MTEFLCSCAGCGRSPDFGKAEMWVQSESGMLCESCWMGLLQKAAASSERSGRDDSEHEFCCFCAVCKRTPPDPDFKIWIETDKGCLCEKCWKEAAGTIIENHSKAQPTGQSGPQEVDIQFGCCQINKKLLIKTLDALSPGERVDVIAENSDVVKAVVGKYAKDRGCSIISVHERNGTCLIQLARP